MATIGHVAAGIAIARAGRHGREAAITFAITAAAVVPDIDLLLGINHRGPTHSIGFAVIVGVATLAAFRAMKHPRPGLVGLLAFGAVLSHIVLDLLTVHSPIAILWPISGREWVLPVVLLPSIPLDERIATIRGFGLVAGELLWSVALVIGAGWLHRAPPRIRTGQEGP